MGRGRDGRSREADDRPEGRSQQTGLAAALGLGGLLLLVVVSVLAASSRAQEIYTQLDQLNTYQRDVETRLRTLRSDVQSSGIFIRDYLLDPERENAPIYR